MEKNLETEWTQNVYSSVTKRFTDPLYHGFTSTARYMHNEQTMRIRDRYWANIEYRIRNFLSSIARGKSSLCRISSLQRTITNQDTTQNIQIFNRPPNHRTHSPFKSNIHTTCIYNHAIPMPCSWKSPSNNHPHFSATTSPLGHRFATRTSQPLTTPTTP